ncbi:MAG: 50S ribosomal protein L9 [Patescibacteria group bacterium]
MKIILLKDVKKVGRKDEIVDVSNGYAQNVLLPQKLGIPATPDQVARLKKQEGSVIEKKAYGEALLTKSINELRGQRVVIRARSNEQGTLFQTIHAKEIAAEIKKTLRVEIPEDTLDVEPIKKTGEYPLTARSSSASAPFTLRIE